MSGKGQTVAGLQLEAARRSRTAAHGTARAHAATCPSCHPNGHWKCEVGVRLAHACWDAEEAVQDAMAGRPPDGMDPLFTVEEARCRG